MSYRYRARAEEAQKEANRSTDEVQRAAWMRIVQGWLGLIRKRPQGDDQEPK
jgi:hypothetical protein